MCPINKNQGKENKSPQTTTRMPDESERGERQVSDSASPESASPESASPESASPDSASPDSASPDSASPDSASPDSASPDSASPDSASPDSASPESAISDLVRSYIVDSSFSDSLSNHSATDISTSDKALDCHKYRRLIKRIKEIERSLKAIQPPDLQAIKTQFEAVIRVSDSERLTQLEALIKKLAAELGGPLNEISTKITLRTDSLDKSIADIKSSQDTREKTLEEHRQDVIKALKVLEPEALNSRIHGIVEAAFNDRVAPTIENLLNEASTLNSSLKESIEESFKKLSETQKLAENLQAKFDANEQEVKRLSKIQEELNERETNLNKFSTEIETARGLISQQNTQKQELDNFSKELEKDRKSNQGLIEQLSELKKSLLDMDSPSLLKHPLLDSERSKLAAMTPEIWAVKGAVYQFHTATEAAKLKPEEVEFLQAIMDSIVQLGFALMRQINGSSTEKLNIDNWRRAVLDSAGPKFKIEVPVVGQAFHMSMMDVSRSGTVQVVKSWAVFSQDQRIRSRLAVVS